MADNQIILSGITPAELVELFKPMIAEQIKMLKDEQPETLLSPASTCKMFNPPISKVTLAAWTKKGLLTENRIGGRVYYRSSEIIEKLNTLRRYNN